MNQISKLTFFGIESQKETATVWCKSPDPHFAATQRSLHILKLKFYKNPYGHTNFFPTLSTDKKQDNIPIDMEVRV